MSYAIPYENPTGQLTADEHLQHLHSQQQPQPQAELLFVPRSKNQWWPMLIPLLMCGLSWTMNGMPLLTDAGFAVFAGLCFFYLVMEFVRFPRRFGIGGIVLYGGVLVWFCHDYFTNWFGRDFFRGNTSMAPWVIAKAATLHVLFVMMMMLGININRGKWAERVVNAIPDPGNESFYFVVMIGMFAIGILPFFFFSAEPFYMGMYHAAFAPWTDAVAWTVFRSGNINFLWGAYVAQILQVGAVGGIFAITYAIVGTRRWSVRIIAFFIWAFWAMMAFNTDRRGEVAYCALPPIALLFIKFQAKAAVMFKRFSLRAYLVCGILAATLLWVVQYQGNARGTSLASADVSEVELFKNQGNSMFSEGLPGYMLIPESHPFFGDSFPGADVVLPIPSAAYWFVIGIVPRALWNSKPVDPLWEWYNSLITGNANGTVGTTISHGVVGNWYFDYGLAGIIEGGLLVGWLMGVSERALQHSNGQLLGMLMSLGLATWIFRAYRDFTYIDLYPLIIGGVALAALVILFRPFLNSNVQPQGFPVAMEQ
jgi:oligosaccharide repeat unit polymerase